MTIGQQIIASSRNEIILPSLLQAATKVNMQAMPTVSKKSLIVVWLSVHRWCTAGDMCPNTFPEFQV